MSANISEVNGINEIFYVGQKPWHGLGTELPKLATAEEAIKAAHLDWEVEKRPLLFKRPDGSEHQVGKRHFAVVRTDIERSLGIAGRDWTPVQNRNAFSLCDGLVEEKAAIYETAGAIQGGRHIWLLAKLNGVCRVKGDDILERYLLLSNTHEGGKALRIGLTTVRVVCQNTLNEALNEAAAKYFRISHTKRVGDKIKDAREALGLINIQNEELNKKFQSLAAVQVRQAQVETFGEALGWKPDSTEDKDKIDWNQFLKAFETAPGQNLESAKGTAWGLVNAVTYLQDHEKTFKAHGDLSAEDNRFKSLWIGGAGEELKSKALNVALALK